MKRCFLVLAALTFLHYPALGAPSYVVKLKSGSQFTVFHHWEEDGMTAFYFHGGVVAIPKHLVSEISESDAPPGRETPSLGYTTGRNEVAGESTLTPPETGEEQGPDRRAKKERALKEMGAGEPTDLKYYKQQRQLLKSRLEEATERFREASANKDLEAKRRAIQEMTETSKQMYSFGKELEKKNKGILPEWWE